jgi:Zn-dependent protease
MNFQNVLLNLVVMIPPMLLAVTLHELAHGWMAFRLGDPTAKQAGRLTINPIKHLDPFGTLAFIITQRIGWAKPVPVNPFNLSNPRKDMMWIAMAGPLTNLTLALVCGILVRFVGSIPIEPEANVLLSILRPLFLMLKLGVILNCGLAVFNALPIPPLDGSSILMGFLSKRHAEIYSKLEPYGFLLLLFILFFPGVRDVFLGGIVYPVMEFLIALFMGQFF